MPGARFRHRLLPHPVSEQGALQGLVSALEAEVSCSESRLQLAFLLQGDLEALRLPEPRPPSRTDGLWRHTCFEVFLSRAGLTEYWEYNLSPSGAWAAYHFTQYREGMAPLMKGGPPLTRLTQGDDWLRLDATLDLGWLLREPDALRIGLSAVIEDRAHILSYWALKHPGAKPDFHHAEGFVIELAWGPAATIPA